MGSSDALHALGTFRRSFYECLHRRTDALFELTDALLTADAAPSPVHLSLQAPHRRGWSSLYAALRRGQMRLNPHEGSERGSFAKDIKPIAKLSCLKRKLSEEE